MSVIKKPVTGYETVALTQEELSYLQSFLNSGDRGGFYVAYYNLTGSSEAILQAQISTFSETVGGIAYLSNVLLQSVYHSSGDYPGIYFISQTVAESAFSFISRVVNAEGGSGLIPNSVFFESAKEAWVTVGVPELFPGNLFFWEEHQAEALADLAARTGEAEAL